MRVLKWLFHPVNIIIVVILFVLFLNRQSLFPELSGSNEMKQLANRIDSVAKRMEQSGDESVMAEAVPGTGKKVTESSLSESEPESITAQSAEGGNMALQQDTVSDAEEEDASESMQQALQAIPAQTRKHTDAGHRGDPRAFLADARRAAWYGDLPGAVAGYKALIAMQPDNYDAYGEMGNVFLAMDDVAAAADAYASSAQLLQQAGYPQAAWQIWAMVSRLDQQKARALYRHLSKGAQPDTRIYRYR